MCTYLIALFAPQKAVGIGWIRPREVGCSDINRIQVVRSKKPPFWVVTGAVLAGGAQEWIPGVARDQNAPPMVRNGWEMAGGFRIWQGHTQIGYPHIAPLALGAVLHLGLSFLDSQ